MTYRRATQDKLTAEAGPARASEVREETLGKGEL